MHCGLQSAFTCLISFDLYNCQAEEELFLYFTEEKTEA